MSALAPKKKPHVPPTDTDWLAQGVEAPLPVPYEVVDSHIHLWDFSDPPYFGDSYGADARAAGIAEAVYVECTMGYRETGPAAERPIGEVEFAQAEAQPSGGVRLGSAIVGWVDATLGDGVMPVLEGQIEAGAGRFRGVRIRAAWDDDPAATYGPGGTPPGFLGQKDCRAAIEALQRLGLSLDVYLFHTQLAEVAELARAMPQLAIVVNHCGAPIHVGRYGQRRAEVRQEWAAGISELAAFDNVFIKIGGFAITRIGLVAREGGAQAPGSEALAAQFAPWAEHCLEAFGPERCMFGSNFPVDKAAMSLPNQVNAMKRLAGKLGPEEASAFMGGTARRFYRI